MTRFGESYGISYQKVGHFFNDGLVMDRSGFCVADETQIEVKSISGIFLVVYPHRESKNLEILQGPRNERLNHVHLEWKLLSVLFTYTVMVLL